MPRIPMALALSLGLISAAEASVVYDWTTTSLSNANPQIIAQFYDPGELIFQDADVASGALAVNIGCTRTGFPPNSIYECSSDRASANYGAGFLTGYLRLNVTFEPGGLAGTASWEDVSLSIDYHLASLSDGSWAGYIGVDPSLSCAPPTWRCPISGYWQQEVPEPATLPLLLGALLILAASRSTRKGQ